MQQKTTTPESLLSELPLDVRESEVSILSEGTSFEGTLELPSIVRMHGALKGTLQGKAGSVIILCESAHIEGRIEADTLWVGGFVRGEITASTKVVLSCTARVIGDIQGASIEIQPGAHFDGTCRIEKSRGSF